MSNKTIGVCNFAYNVWCMYNVHVFVYVSIYISAQTVQCIQIHIHTYKCKMRQRTEQSRADEWFRLHTSYHPTDYLLCAKHVFYCDTITMNLFNVAFFTIPHWRTFWDTRQQQRIRYTIIRLWYTYIVHI